MKATTELPIAEAVAESSTEMEQDYLAEDTGAADEEQPKGSTGTSRDADLTESTCKQERRAFKKLQMVFIPSQ